MVAGNSDHGNTGGFGDKMEQTCKNNGHVQGEREGLVADASYGESVI